MGAKRFSAIGPGLAALALILCACATRAVAPVDRTKSVAAAAKGWAALWADDFPAAVAAFAEALPDPLLAAEAGRGTALAKIALGDQGGALEAAVASIESDPDSAYSSLLREFIERSVIEGDKTAAAFTRIDAALAARTGNPWAQRTALRNRLLDLPISKSRADFDAITGALGVLGAWTFLGPFEDLSGRGIGKAFLSENFSGSAAALEESPRGADGRVPAWVDPVSLDADGRVYPSEHCGGGNAVYYARTVAQAPEAGDYVLVLDRSCALKVWVDGKLVLEDAVQRTGNDMHWQRLNLSKGAHTVIVKEADIGGLSWFRLSLRRAGTDAAADVALANAVAAVPGIERVEPDPLIGRIAAGIERGSPTEIPFWLSFALTMKGQPWAGLEAAERAPAKASAYFSYLRWIAYSKAGRRVESRQAIFEPAAKGRLFAPSQEARIREALAQGRKAEAAALLKEFEAAAPRALSVPAFKTILRAMDEKDAAYADLKRFREANPGMVYLESLLLMGGGYGMDMGLVVGAVPQTVQSLELSSQLVDVFMDEGDYAKAWALSSRLKEIWGGHGGSWQRYLSAGMRSGSLKLDGAESALDQARSSFVLNGAIARTGFELSDSILASMDRSRLVNSQAAIPADLKAKEESRRLKYLRACLSIDPGDGRLRDRLRKFDGLKDLDAAFPETDPVEAVKAHRADSAAPRGKDATVILDERAALYFPDGGYRIYASRAIEVNSAKGVDLEGTQVLDGFHPLSDRQSLGPTFAIRPDGTRLPPLFSGDRVVFPGLKPGDCIVVSYEVNGARSGGLADQFWTWDAFSDSYPIRRKSLKVAYPSGSTPKISIHADPAGTVKSEKAEFEKGMSMVSFSVANAPAARPDPGFEWRESYVWVDVSTVGSWSDISRWYYDLADGRADPTPYLRRKAAEICAGASGRAEKIKRLFDFVSRGLRYEDLSFQYSAYVPQRAESVLDDGYGDCKDKSALLIALLRSSGIEAGFALSDSEYHGGEAFLPSTRFDHAIVLVPGGEGGVDPDPLALDPTSEYSTYPELPEGLAGTNFLTVGTAPAVLERLGTETRAFTSILLAIKAGPERDEAKGAAIFHGDYAAMLRYVLKTKDQAASLAALREMLSAGMPGLRITAIDVQAADSLAAAPVLKYVASVPGTLKRGPTGMWVELPWPMPLEADSLLDAPSAMRQGGSLRLARAAAARQTLVVELPAGAKAFPFPKDEEFIFGESRAAFIFRTDMAGRLVCEYEYRIASGTIGPDKAAAFEVFAKGIRAKQAERIPVVVP